MPSVYISTMGCRVNQSESDKFLQKLLKKNFIYDEVAPDICIINTWSVIQKAEKKTRYRIRQLKKFYPNATVIVMGCYPEYLKRFKNELKHNIGADVHILFFFPTVNSY